ncbi:hypothetical protein [Pandoraea anhela]|uniref:Uncharacterized protein n=1 Tax=Pandoraea anhela TaxID=2508295 RepID=A0A5E4T6Q6_9BURK|nr:hypothetical protein [Pandoraea anhela]VVD82653.1 hypothetical protein PAN31108_01188 [Pandoraea anhela]
MHVPSQPLPGYWPQLSDWQVKAGEAPTRRPAASFTSIRNRLPEGHAIRTGSRGASAHVVPTDLRTELGTEMGMGMATGMGPEMPTKNGCRGVHVDDYTHNVLTALVTPKDGCPSRRYARNAELRNSVATALALHPQGGDALLEAWLKALGLPSLLRDEPQYLPGTLAALRYDVGSRIVAIGRSQFPDLAQLDAPGDFALHAAGARELSYLDGESPHAAQVAHDHKRILDFHYGAAGVSTWQSLPGAERLHDSREGLDRRAGHDVNGSGEHSAAGATGTARAPTHEARRIDAFIAHLERCRQRVEPQRIRSKARGRIPIQQTPATPALLTMAHEAQAQRARRKASKPKPPPYPLSPQHDILYNCTLL